MGSKLVSFETAVTKWNGAPWHPVNGAATGGNAGAEQNAPQSRAQFSILVVDDRDVNRQWLATILTNEGSPAARYRVVEARSAEDAVALMQREPVDLVIVDHRTEGFRGAECCRAIWEERRRDVLTLMLVPDHGLEEENLASKAGVSEFLATPFHPEVLRERVRSMLRYRAQVENPEESETILFALALAVEQRDNYTSGHCERLAMFSVALGMAMGLTRPDLVSLHRGGYLHDIGKVGMPDSILFKPGPLSEEEWRIMRTHTVRGEEICRPLRCLMSVLPIIRSHHERWNGAGYPDGLRGRQIPLLARVLQLADVFDALTSARPYKPSLNIEQALTVMREEADRGWYERELFGLFLSLPHNALKETATLNAAGFEDVDVMRHSLENLRTALE